MIAEALSSVPLADDQRAEIEKIASDADARHLAAAGARGEIVTALAAQIEAGKIDRPALQAKIDAVADAANDAHPADQAAIQRSNAATARAAEPGRRRDREPSQGDARGARAQEQGTGSTRRGWSSGRRT